MYSRPIDTNDISNCYNNYNMMVLINSAADLDLRKIDTSTVSTTFSSLFKTIHWYISFTKMPARGVKSCGDMRKLTFSEGPLKSLIWQLATLLFCNHDILYNRSQTFMLKNDIAIES